MRRTPRLTLSNSTKNARSEGLELITTFITDSYGKTHRFQWLPGWVERVPVASRRVRVASQRYSVRANRFYLSAGVGDGRRGLRRAQRRIGLDRPWESVRVLLCRLGFRSMACGKSEPARQVVPVRPARRTADQPPGRPPRDRSIVGPAGPANKSDRKEYTTCQRNARERSSRPWWSRWASRRTRPRSG
jgi:hypothetical protein